MHSTTPGNPLRAPSLIQRSKMELEMTAHLMEAALGTGGATLHGLWQALYDGDFYEHTDAVFELGRGKRKVMHEWDGVMWHTPETLEKDVRKTRRMLASNSTAIILRVRADGAPPFEDALVDGGVSGEDMERIVCVYLTPGKYSQNHGLALREVAKVLVARLSAQPDGVPAEVLQRLKVVAERSS